jgi:hypothetical protein
MGQAWNGFASSTRNVWHPVVGPQKSQASFEKSPSSTVLGSVSVRDPDSLGLPDPDPLVRGPDPDTSLCHKGVERTEIILAK